VFTPKILECVCHTGDREAYCCVSGVRLTTSWVKFGSFSGLIVDGASTTWSKFWYTTTLLMRAVHQCSLQKLIEVVFTGNPLPKSFGVGILVLIPKGVPDQYRGIALLEVIYKLVSAITNQRLTAQIAFHDAGVHGFCVGRGTNTAIIELKLRMQLAQRTTKPLYFVFLELKKA
jgi:hypothetical protein